ncbi:MAG: contractile injection system tape measure protein, partial [Pseudomonadota bacterium]
AAREMARAAAEQVLQGQARTEPSTLGAEHREPDRVESAPIPTLVAGVVILHPYIKLLFKRLDVLNEQGRIADGALDRAYSILSYLTLHGGPPDPMHYILLGLEGRPRLTAQSLEDSARTMINGLLEAIISQWGKLGKTSPDGLRETFLRRDGFLTIEPNSGTRLSVAPGPFDMLLDALPWSLSPVGLPWMIAPCHVDWRSKDG